MSSKFTYQTLQVANQSPFVGGPTSQGSRVQGGVKLLYTATKALSGFSFSWRINHEIEKKKSEMLQVIQTYEASIGQSRADVGVLVIVGYQESTNSMGDKIQYFIDVVIGAAGVNAADVYRSFIARPRFVQGAPKGWTRKETYTWATRSSY